MPDGGSSQLAYGTKEARSEKPATAVIAVVALGLLLKVKIGEPWLVLGAGAVGVALRLVLHVG